MRLSSNVSANKRRFRLVGFNSRTPDSGFDQAPVKETGETPFAETVPNGLKPVSY